MYYTFSVKEVYFRPLIVYDRTPCNLNRRWQVLSTVIGKESLNFEDEISLRGVECNIPLDR